MRMRLNTYLVNGLKLVKEINPTQSIYYQSFLYEPLRRQVSLQEIYALLRARNSSVILVGGS